MHSGISDSRMWDPQWTALTRSFHAIRYDARGFGSSADPRRPYTLHGDGMEVLDALEVEKAAVVGSSMGGYAALDMAIALPHRVERARRRHRGAVGLDPHAGDQGPVGRGRRGL